MKNYNLNLTLVPYTENTFLSFQNDVAILQSQDWLRKKSLSTKTIKNYKSVIDCIIEIIAENIPLQLLNNIQLAPNTYYIGPEHAPTIIDVIDGFAIKHELSIHKKLAELIYVYELTTYNELIKEITSHIKVLIDYLKQLKNDFSLILISEYTERKFVKQH